MLKSLLVSTLLLGAGLCQRGGGRRPTTISRGQTQTQTVTQIQTQTRAPNGGQTIWGQCEHNIRLPTLPSARSLDLKYLELTTILNRRWHNLFGRVCLSHFCILL